MIYLGSLSALTAAERSSNMTRLQEMDSVSSVVQSSKRTQLYQKSPLEKLQAVLLWYKDRSLLRDRVSLSRYRASWLVLIVLQLTQDLVVRSGIEAALNRESKRLPMVCE